jgi:hypothetical protein
VHCYLEGKSQDEAAQLLGVSRAALKKRLEVGRAMLRTRLVRRGLGPGAILPFSAWPAAKASALVPFVLLDATVNAVALLGAGEAVKRVISPRVLALMEGVLKAMFLTKLKSFRRWCQDPSVATGYMGDYDQVAADNANFYTTWGDNRLSDTGHANQPDVRFSSIPINPTTATDFSVTASTSSTTAGSPFSLTATALDASGHTVTNYSGTVHFTSSDGQAVLPADYTFTGSDQGVHTFTNGVTLKTAGSQTVTVTDTSNSSITGNTNVTVTAAAASHFPVGGFPSPVTAGTAGNFTVTALDPYGNTASGYTGTIHFTSSDSQAALPAA